MSQILYQPRVWTLQSKPCALDEQMQQKMVVGGFGVCLQFSTELPWLPRRFTRHFRVPRHVGNAVRRHHSICLLLRDKFVEKMFALPIHDSMQLP